MAKSQQYQPPRRKEPGLIGQLFSALVQLMVWLVISLMLSIIIEWLGMIWFWPEQGADHAQAVLASDQAYLNSQLYEHSLNTKHAVAEKAQNTVIWVKKQTQFNANSPNINARSNKTMNSISEWSSEYYRKAEPYLEVHAR